MQDSLYAAIASNIYRSQDAPRYILGRQLYSPFLVISSSDIDRWQYRRPGTHVRWHWVCHTPHSCDRVYAYQRKARCVDERNAREGYQINPRGAARARRSRTGLQIYIIKGMYPDRRVFKMMGICIPSTVLTPTLQLGYSSFNTWALLDACLMF